MMKLKRRRWLCSSPLEDDGKVHYAPQKYEDAAGENNKKLRYIHQMEKNADGEVMQPDENAAQHDTDGAKDIDGGVSPDDEKAEDAEVAYAPQK